MQSTHTGKAAFVKISLTEARMNDTTRLYQILSINSIPPCGILKGKK